MNISVMKLKILKLFFFTSLFISCKKYEYSKCISLSKTCWMRNQPCIFDNILIQQDKIYSIKIILHYNDEFPFQNIYLKIDMESNDKQLVFSDIQNHFLFDPLTGYPINDNNILLKHNASFIVLRQLLNKGSYKIIIKQFNRIEHLKGIQQIQLIIE